MARRCQLSGKAPTFGHNVSHSNVKTNRRFNPNLQKVTLYSEGLRRRVPLRICTRTLRSVQKLGGLDPFLLKMDEAKLAPEGQRLKRQLKRALGPGPGAGAGATASN